MYSENDLVRIAKRENNNKRSYLVVNPLQGKHVPVSPTAALEMFEQLADLIKENFCQERLLLIGFAETATAIGAAAANILDCQYMQTTREQIPGVEYLFFSEEHSHATEQKLVKDDVDEIVKKIDRIVFIEDEVTTGNTILNIVNILNEKYPQMEKFAVASLLNGMNETCLERYRKRNIELFYLVKTNHDDYADKANQFSETAVYLKPSLSQANMDNVHAYKVQSYRNARRLVDMLEYREAVKGLCDEISTLINVSNEQNILVIGTEEFMYPALFVAGYFEKEGKCVKCHSTTRSPIAVFKENNYPLHKRFELVSFYDDNRVTYIYDLTKYDHVIIITDAKEYQGNGAKSLVSALQLSGNENISIVGWSIS